MTKRAPIRPAPLDDIGTTCELLASITGDDREQVLDRLAREHQRLGSTVFSEMAALQLTPHEWSDRLVEFYAQTSAFLYESYVWNRTQMKQRMRDWIVERLQASSSKPLRVLAFGDGLGLDSAALALSGHHVTYFEVGRRAAEFADEVFKLNNVQVAQCRDLSALADASQDVVVCLDVLEHVPDPCAVVQDMVRVLSPKGTLIVSAPFWHLNWTVSTHLRSNRRYTADWRALFGPAGLRPVDTRFLWSPLVLERGPPKAPSLLTPAGRRVALSHCLLQAVHWRLIHLSAVVHWIVGNDTRKVWQHTTLPAGTAAC